MLDISKELITVCERFAPKAFEDARMLHAKQCNVARRLIRVQRAIDRLYELKRELEKEQDRLLLHEAEAVTKVFADAMKG